MNDPNVDVDTYFVVFALNLAAKAWVKYLKN